MTHLLGNPDAGRAELREVAAWELEAGDVVVLVRGSDRDAIRAHVDEIAPAGLREAATTWQRALRRFAEGRDSDDVVARLADAGCRRRPSTLSRWLADDTMIRPRHGGKDIDAIARMTGDPELTGCLDECVAACDELFRFHVQAGMELTLRVRERARGWISTGIAPDEVVDIDDRLAVVTVDSVDGELVDVPRGLLGRLQEDGT